MNSDPKNQRWKSTKYRRWIRDHGKCFVCGIELVNEKPNYISHHHRHASWNDAMLVQICLKHHNEFHHNEARFNEMHELTDEHWLILCTQSLGEYLSTKNINGRWVMLNALMEVVKEI